MAFVLLLDAPERLSDFPSLPLNRTEGLWALQRDDNWIATVASARDRKQLESIVEFTSADTVIAHRNPKCPTHVAAQKIGAIYDCKLLFYTGSRKEDAPSHHISTFVKLWVNGKLAALERPPNPVPSDTDSATEQGLQ